MKPYTIDEICILLGNITCAEDIIEICQYLGDNKELYPVIYLQIWMFQIQMLRVFLWPPTPHPK